MAARPRSEPSSTTTPPTAAAPGYYRTRDLLARFRISRRSFERRLAEGEFPQPVRLGAVRLWPRTVIETFEQRLLADRPVRS